MKVDIEIFPSSCFEWKIQLFESGTSQKGTIFSNFDFDIEVLMTDSRFFSNSSNDSAKRL